LQLEVLILFLK